MIDLSPWLETFEAARARALRGEAEGLHDLRTSARRLRVWLQLAQLRVLEDDLRWLCRETSELRDLDVLGALLTPAGRRALRPTAERRAKAALESRRVQGVVAALRCLPALRPAFARVGLAELERSLTRATPRTDDEVHALRRRVRRVRYAREWLGVDASDLQRAQDVLGVVCDVLVLQALVARTPAR
jgi:CHAD domain-containing protein